MSHQRLAVNAIAIGTDLDSIPYADQYRCDGCRKIFAPGDLYRVQGQAFRQGVGNGFVSADICQVCIGAMPVRAFIQGMTA